MEEEEGEGGADEDNGKIAFLGGNARTVRLHPLALEQSSPL